MTTLEGNSDKAIFELRSNIDKVIIESRKKYGITQEMVYMVLHNLTVLHQEIYLDNVRKAFKALEVKTPQTKNS